MSTRNQRDNRYKVSQFDLVNIGKYIILSVIFTAIIFGLRTIVMSALSASPVPKIGNGFVSLTEVHNYGAAFNLLQGQPEMIIMSSFLAVAILAFIVIFASGRLNHSMISAMALLSSGIIMNLLERLTQGYVIDYIYLDFLPNIPMFNAADIMIVFGALGLILAILDRD